LSGPLRDRPERPRPRRSSLDAEAASRRQARARRPETPDGPGLLGLQRGAGNAAVAGRFGQRQAAASAALVHRGSRPLHLDLSRLASRAVLWDPNWWLLEDWRSGAAAPGGADQELGGQAPARVDQEAGAAAGPVVAGPGWSWELPFGHGFEPGPDRMIQAFAELIVVERDLPVQVGLVATSPFV
jgi:hypothetical protein